MLDVSAEVPANALGVHPDLSPEIRLALREALLGMHASEQGQRALRQFGAQRFIETSLGRACQPYSPWPAVLEKTSPLVAEVAPAEPEGRCPQQRSRIPYQ